MTDKEFEKIIKERLSIHDKPNRASFAYMLSQLESPVTEKEDMRYTRETGKPSQIINSKITYFISVCKSRRLVLIPSLLLILFIGAFSLSQHTRTYDQSIEQLATQDESIQEPSSIDDDEIILTNFDDQALDDLSNI